MAPRHNPQRSTRSSTRMDLSVVDDSLWFPDIKNPESLVHRWINALNHKAYPSDIFAKADDILVFTMFARKGKKHWHYVVVPAPAQTHEPILHLLKEEGMQGAHICKELFLGNKPSWEIITQLVEDLQQQISKFQSEDKRWSACLKQYVHFFTYARLSVSFFGKFALQIFTPICTRFLCCYT